VNDIAHSVPRKADMAELLPSSAKQSGSSFRRGPQRNQSDFRRAIQSRGNVDSPDASIRVERKRADLVGAQNVFLG
jgi:hypothetical protein